MNQHIKYLISQSFSLSFTLLTSILLTSASHGATSEVASDKLFTQAQIKQDFAQLYEDLQLAHYDLYANTSKQIYDRAYQSWSKKITGPMSLRDTKVLFQQFMALGDIAHSRIDLPMQDFSSFMQDGGAMFPMFFSLKGNDAYIDTVYVDHPALQPGNQIISINKRPITQWLQEIRSYISADNQDLSNTLIENTLPFYLWLILGEQQEFTIEVKTSSGNQQLIVNAVTNEQRQQFRKSALQSQDLTTQEAKVLEGNIGYLRPGPFYNTTPGAEDIWDNSQFVAFVDEAYKNFMENDVKALLIDLRNNPGGTNSFSDPVIAWFADKPFRFASEFAIKVSPQSAAANEKRLAISKQNDATSLQLKAFYDSHEYGDTFTMSLPDAQPKAGKHFDKPVFVLVNRYSYSNAVSFAAIVQDYKFGTVIGEKTADLATTYGAMEHFDLSHTGITIGYPKALIIRPNGDTTPDGVTPDIALNTKSGEDLLDLALAYIRSQN